MPIPYNIQCTTCHRVLTVRTAAAVGKILPCPKCGSMVMIEPPPDGVLTTNGPAGSKALVSDDPQEKDTVPDPAAHTAQPVPATTGNQTTVDEAAAAANTLSGDWMSSETRQLKRWLMIGAASLAAVILIIVGMGIWFSNQKDESPEIAKAQPQPAPTATSSTNSDDDQQPTGPADDNNEPPATGDNDKGPADSATSDDNQPATPQPNPVNPPVPIVEPPVADDPPMPQAPMPETPMPMPAGDSDRPPGGRPALSVDEALRDFEGLLEDSTFDRTLMRADSDYDLIPAPAERPDFSNVLPRPKPINVNTETQLAQRLPAVEFNDVPLRRFLEFVTHFTTAPVTLDLDALWRAGISPLAPVTVNTTNEPLSAILERALEPLGLSYSLEERHIIVRPRNEFNLETRTYDVQDLVQSDPVEEQALVQVLTALIAPRTWSAMGGGGTATVESGRMTVHQLPGVHFHVLMFCERLRIARGLPPHGIVPEPWPDQEPRIRLGLAALSQPLTANYVSPTPFVDILSYLEEAGDIQILVDWQALGAVGWNPAALARIEATEQPLSEILQSLLAPMELSYRVIDGNTLQVTSARAAYSTLDLEFYSVGDIMAGDDGQKLLEGIRTILGDALVTDRVPGGVRVDGKSQSIIVSAPQYQQAAIARLIEQLASDSDPPPPPSAADEKLP